MGDFKGFVGESYVYPSISFDAQRSINLMPVISETKDSKAIDAMMKTPGRALFAALTGSYVRGGHSCIGRAFFVAGSTFYEVLADGTNVSRGTLQTAAGWLPASAWADSGTQGYQVELVDGPNCYCFNMLNNTLTNVGTNSGGADLAPTQTGTVSLPATGNVGTSGDGIQINGDTAITLDKTAAALVTAINAQTTVTGVTANLSASSFLVLTSATPNLALIIALTGNGASILGLQDGTWQAEPPPGAGWLGSNTVCFIDGYFIFAEPGTAEYYFSNLYDGTTLDPLNFASKTGGADNISGVMALHDQIWTLGTETIQMLYDSGNFPLPFQPIQGAFIQYGCSSAASIAQAANTVLWTMQDQDGNGAVMAAQGFNAQRVSTFAIEFQLQQYDMSTAQGFTYQENGHWLYVLNVSAKAGGDAPTTSFVFDVNIQQWHERGIYKNGAYNPDPPSCHIFCFGLHLVGDRYSGNVYQQSQNIYDDNGTEIRWERTAPHLFDGEDLDNIFYHWLQIDLQTGVGLTNGQDSNPQIMAQWSNDGGHTWGNEHWRSAGKVGQYRVRAVWRQLGRARDRVFRIAGTAACQTFIIAAKILASKGTH